MVELIDLPDEMILAIMNKIKPRVLLLCSIFDIGNNRLEQLVLDKYHSIDLTFDYVHSPYESLIQRFYFNILPYISDRIQSLALNLVHSLHFDTILKRYSDDIVFNLTHLKIILGRFHRNSGMLFEIGCYYDSMLRPLPLVSFVPEFFELQDDLNNRVLSLIQCSSLMRTIVSLELDDRCAFEVSINPEELFLSRSLHLTHLRLAVTRLEDCVRLLNQRHIQLHSLSVTVGNVCRNGNDRISEITSIFCPHLKQLTMTIYRNILHYEQLLLLLQRLSSIEHLTLLLAIGVTGTRPDHLIDGLDLQRDIATHMPHLRQFNFHIRSILRHAPHIDIETIRQSFVDLQPQQSVDCVLDYFNNHYGQCQIFSLPFIGTRLDFISNRFPLSNVNNTFSNVTTLLLFDDIKPFENTFFERMAQALPRLRTLDVFNQLQQDEKMETTTNFTKFPRLTALILHNIHVDYAEQLLCRSHLPSLIELVIRNDALSVIIANNDQHARDNCSKVERLCIVDPWIEPTSAQLTFFPLV